MTLEPVAQSPFKIKTSVHVVGWIIFFVAPVILSPGRDVVAYFSEPAIIVSLIVRNVVLMILFYANLFYLTPKLFNPGSQAKFFVLMGLLILFVGSLNYVIHEILNGTFNDFQNPPKPPPEGFGSPGFPNGDRPPPRRLMLASPYFSSILIAALVATASTLLVLWNNWAQAKANEQERNLQKVAAELSMLKLQISPHFLFNTLNNIRWLVRSKSDHAESALIKLSQLLRYILYQANENFVDLHKEITHLEDYIALQKMRLSEGEKIEFVVAGDLYNKQIVPLLLIPIVENFFKHGDFNHGEKSTIELVVNDYQLIFRTVNRILQKSQDNELEDSGIGIGNVKKRLMLHYPNNHMLHFQEVNGNYILTLEINLV
jgi:hypothetical protein